MQVNSTIIANWLLRKCTTSLQILFVFLIHQLKLHVCLTKQQWLYTCDIVLNCILALTALQTVQTRLNIIY